MDKEQWKHITRVLDKVLTETSDQKRDHIIKTECGNDAILQKDVYDFLEAVRDSDTFWDDLSQSRNRLTADLFQKYAKTEPDTNR
jgi:hypothetical protein